MSSYIMNQYTNLLMSGFIRSILEGDFYVATKECISENQTGAITRPSNLNDLKTVAASKTLLNGWITDFRGMFGSAFVYV